MVSFQDPSSSSSSSTTSTSFSQSQTNHLVQQHHLHHHNSADTLAVASSSRHTLDYDQPQSAAASSLPRPRHDLASTPCASTSRRRGSAVSPPSSPAQSPRSDYDDDDHLGSDSLKGSQSLHHSHRSDHPTTTAMATLSVHTPPAVHQPDPMLFARATNSPLQKSIASLRAASPSPPPPLAAAPYTQPPVTSSLANVTAGDGWAIIPKSATAQPSATMTMQAPSPATSSATAAQQSAASGLLGLSQAAYASAAADLSNRRCGPADASTNFDVPFGERASPAIISLSQRGARPLSRSGTRPPSPLTLSPAMQSEALNPSGAHRGGLRGSDEDVEIADKDVPMNTDEDSCTSTGATPLVPPATRKLCVRHQRMADEGTTARLQKIAVRSDAGRKGQFADSKLCLLLHLGSPQSIESLPLSDQTAVNTVWSLFSSSSHSRRALILQGILTMCCFSQLSLLSSELALAIRIDPFSLFPREVSLKVLGHLDAISLGRAAQVSRSWKQLADDDLLWRNMCEQHIERKCEKCGWGLPLLSERRRRAPGPAVQLGTPERAISAPTAPEPPPHSRSASGQRDLQMRDRDAPPLKKQRSGLNGEATPCSSTGTVPKTRPWKSVYCERLAIERNWRRGRFTSRTLAGHTDGIMCLQFNENLAHPAFPVVITGSYDRTARIWNLETGEMLRVLEGHTRGVRCLQFDEAKLITGSMDRTLKIWNWRTGALMRTLEGHTEGIVCLHFNEDTLASGSADSNIKIWNFRTGECYTLRGHRDWVNAVTLWTGPAAKKRQQRLREALREGRPAASIKDEDPRAAGTFLFSASDDGSIRLWDLGLRECLLTFEGHVGQVQSLKLVMMDDEAVRKLVGGAAGGVGAESPQAQRNGASRRGSVHGSGDGDDAPDTVENGDQDMLSLEDQESYFLGDASLSHSRRLSGGLPARNAAGRRPSNAAENGERLYGAARRGATGPSPLSSSSTAAAASSSSQQRQQRRRIDKALLRVQERLCEAGLVDPLPLDAEMGDLDPSMRGARNGSGNRSGDESGGQSGRAGDGEANGAGANGERHHAKPRPVLISGSLDNTLKVWDVRTGRCIRTLFGHVEGVWSLDVDKLRIVSASHDRTIKIWDRDTGLCQNTIVGHKGAVTCVSLTDDKIVSGSDDGDIKVWSFAANAAASAGVTANVPAPLPPVPHSQQAQHDGRAA
ncbi:glucose-6-phosphate 1-dehydrogenase [Moesziomyces antarcticus T-34]|uniref:Glucose-6-phosphate 1-dehydrogenase n=1 Tax=Pseudozyma antarctica (strain T-34) TaxID=1151754 RepID=M9M7Z4_PSEA3|nr:glucose-6-phosphate 1-dehydrogenase [Moesziomyces antarcticus T-34]